MHPPSYHQDYRMLLSPNRSLSASSALYNKFTHHYQRKLQHTRRRLKPRGSETRTTSKQLGLDRCSAQMRKERRQFLPNALVPGAFQKPKFHAAPPILIEKIGPHMSRQRNVVKSTDLVCTDAATPQQMQKMSERYVKDRRPS